MSIGWTPVRPTPWLGLQSARHPAPQLQLTRVSPTFTLLAKRFFGPTED